MDLFSFWGCFKTNVIAIVIVIDGCLFWHQTKDGRAGTATCLRRVQDYDYVPPQFKSVYKKKNDWVETSINHHLFRNLHQVEFANHCRPPQSRSSLHTTCSGIRYSGFTWPSTRGQGRFFRVNKVPLTSWRPLPCVERWFQTQWEDHRLVHVCTTASPARSVCAPSWSWPRNALQLSEHCKATKLYLCI